MVQKWLEQRALCILQEARDFQHICGFIAESRLLFVDEAIMYLWSIALSPGYALFFFNCWLKYSIFKFFIKKRKTKEWDQSPTLFCSKFATSKIRGHNMFPLIISACLKLGCEKPSLFKLMEFGIETRELSVFKKQ